MEVQAPAYLTTAIARTIGERCAWQQGGYDPARLSELQTPYLERYSDELVGK